MPDTLIIVLFSVLFLFLIGIAVALLVIVLRKRKPDVPVINQNAESLGEVKAKIDALSSAIPSAVSQSMAEAKNQLSKELTVQVAAQSEITNAKLERFQENIGVSISTKFASLDTQINQKFTGFDTKIDGKFVEINKMVNEGLKGGFETTTKAVGEVKERLATIDEAQKGLNALSENVVDLTTILSGNQSRGQFGEMTLETILHSVFGDTTDTYAMQYVIAGKGEKEVRPDAVVFMPEPNKMVCIDSKFPYLDYKRLLDSHEEKDEEMLKRAFRDAVKKHINAVKSKYIIPGVTAVQALLFIPSDGVFVYVHSQFPDVVAEARNSEVILTSPSTLQPILATIKMLRINYARSEKYQELSVELNKLGKDFDKFAEEWDGFSRSVDTLSNKTEAMDKRVNLINRKFTRIKTSDIGQIEEVSSTNVETQD